MILSFCYLDFISVLQAEKFSTYVYLSWLKWSLKMTLSDLLNKYLKEFIIYIRITLYTLI